MGVRDEWWSTAPASVPNVALASVVPCQAGVSVLLRPHGPDVANVLPAVQKIAQMGAQRGEKKERQRENGGEE